MRKTTTHFVFQVPADWLDVSSPALTAFRGRAGEILILAAVSIQGKGDERERQSLRECVAENAIRAARNSTDDRNLRVRKPIGPDSACPVGECFTIYSEIVDGKTLFAQAIISATPEVVLVTFEGPNNDAAKNIFREFLQNVEPFATEPVQVQF